jgi:hypothetical protein
MASSNVEVTDSRLINLILKAFDAIQIWRPQATNVKRPLVDCKRNSLPPWGRGIGFEHRPDEELQEQFDSQT